MKAVICSNLFDSR